MKRIAMLMALALAGVGASGAAGAETKVPGSDLEVKLSYAPVVKAVVPSVVNIYAKRVVESRASPFANDPFFREFFGDLRARPRLQNSLGSGVILGDGLVVSNFHVVGNATDIRVVLADKREYDAELVLGDAQTDLAVLRMRDAPDLPALGFADSDAVEVGDLVLAVGNPFGVGQTVSSGIISARARTGQVAGRKGYFIQTDAPINPGNSGGALVDMAGRLVGINSAIVTRSGGSNGIGFAIPGNLVRQYVRQAEAGAEALERPWAGVTVQPIDGPLAEALGLDRPQGVLISALHPASPFAAAGLTVGDVVTAIGGHPVDGGPEMLFRLMTMGVGGTTEVGYLHDFEPETSEVALITAPEDPPREPITVTSQSVLRGLSVANLNPALISEMGLGFEAKGVVVVGVDGEARRARLRKGDILRAVNGEAIERSTDLSRITRARPRVLEITFERGGQRGVLRLRNR
ncbi:Periplasmic serine protease, DO/DeqQ family [Candidatus Rhodobacter oscarellae]|uniref:Periplasmic serine protease, DO/DeqQ family n=1 Tax=Candidatus Rhodobacter oscarellae TaxID=1675527 RepID=A0A0J9E4I3_9RHOB|nr:trypsin-like peptidase domain-containing protein [Candidatus Rhodobacter lobularis]KMW56739.1 Periplasmic serine protease, DO/DeqQ family [Candidatus Rhodobacter lobularis]